MPVFRSAYKQAKAVGLPFPVADDAAVEPLFTPMSGSVVPAEVAPASHASHPEVAPDMSAPPGLARPASAQTSPAPPAAAASRVDADTQQLMTQLDTVRARVGDMTALIDAAQKVQSAESPVSPSGADLLSNETFLDLLDFLEQCHPRFVAPSAICLPYRSHISVCLQSFVVGGSGECGPAAGSCL